MTSTIAAAVTTVTGDPDAIRATGRRWRTAAMACAAAAAQVGAVAVVDGFLGDEAGTWEERLQPGASTLLSTLATARDIVGGALVSYADVLEACQQELRTLAVDRTEAGVALDRWRDTPIAEPDLVDSATQTVHDLDARSAAVLARHAAAVRACCVQIDRATAMAPGHVAGVRAGTAAVRASGGPGRYQQSSNAVTAGFRLTHPAQLSAIGPFMATDNPQDMVDDDTKPTPPPWIDPALQATYRDRFYNACLGMQAATRIPGDNTEMICGVNADAIVESRENILIGLRTYPNALTQEEVYGLDDALADGWDFFTDIMIGGCKTGGSIGACIFDIVSAPIPFAKGAKVLKVGVELVEDGADVVKAGEKAADAGTATKVAEAARPIEIAPGKYDYFFGNVTSSAKNRLRSEAMELELDRIGIRDNPVGRALVERNLREAAGRSDNIVERRMKNGNVTEIRESLLAGPFGFVRVRSFWIVENGKLRLTTAVFEGGQR